MNIEQMARAVQGKPIDGEAGERETFEAIIRNRWANICLDRLRQKPEKYALDQVDLAWQMWNERAALSAPSESNERDRLDAGRMALADTKIHRAKGGCGTGRYA